MSQHEQKQKLNTADPAFQQLVEEALRTSGSEQRCDPQSLGKQLAAIGRQAKAASESVKPIVESDDDSSPTQDEPEWKSEPRQDRSTSRGSQGQFNPKMIAATVMFGAISAGVLWFVKDNSVGNQSIARSSIQMKLDRTGKLETRSTEGIVFSREPYSLTTQAQTARKYGWVFHIHRGGAWLCYRLVALGPNQLSGTYDDEFDDEEGFEYFVTILTDEDRAELNLKDKAGSWLTPTECQELQRQGREGAPFSQADDIIRKAVDRLGLSGPFEIQLQRFRHVMR